MLCTIEEAVESLQRAFPTRSVTVEDGDYDYLVGTIEDEHEAILASFLLSLDGSGRNVTEIRVSEGQKFCGTAAEQIRNLSLRDVVPIQVTRHSDEGWLWGLVGDYEVCIRRDSIIQVLQ